MIKDIWLSHRLTRAYQTMRPYFVEDGFCGWWINYGWNSIVLDAHEELIKIDPNYKLTQLKEKFGTLRYYAVHDTTICKGYQGPGQFHSLNSCDFIDIIIQTEKLSEITCERCGSFGQLRDHGFVRTLCDHCDQYYEYY